MTPATRAYNKPFMNALCASQLESGPAVNGEDDIDGLAAEYVLGSLDAAERRQVDALRPTDANLAAAIIAWERRLGPPIERGQDVTPPAHVFDGVLSRISGQTARTDEVLIKFCLLQPGRDRQRRQHDAALLSSSVVGAAGGH